MRVFISYAREDEAVAVRLQAFLEKLGYTVWRDRSEIKPGDDWLSEIQNGLNKAEAVIGLMSPDAIKSKWMMKEVNFALNRSLPLILVRLCEIDLGSFSQFAMLQYIDCFDMSIESEVFPRINSVLASYRYNY